MLEGDIVGGGGEAPLEVCTLFHRLNRFKSFPNTTKDQVHESHIIFSFWSENVPKFIFHLAYLTSPYSHPSILVPLTYELEQYFLSKRYPSIGNRSPTANLSRTSKQSDLHKVLPLRFSFIKCGGGRPLMCR